MDCCGSCSLWQRLKYDMGYCYSEEHLEEKEINDPAKHLTGRDEWCAYYQKS